jgi:predicted DNA-binding transcriptional regulator AlpA
MADADAQRATGDERLYTLSDISQKTGISMPTLQRYKKLYQGRIPSVGSGRKQRYPESALPVFDEIRNENIGRRGRPRKDASAAGTPARRGPGRPAASGRGRKSAAAVGRKGTRTGRVGRPAAKSAAAPVKARRGRPPGRANKRTAGGLLTLTQISETTGISYPTLVRYVRLHSDRLPHEGKGRARRFHPQAVDVFRTLRQESGRGGRKPSGRATAPAGRGRPAASADTSALTQRIKVLEKSQAEIEKRFRGLAQSLQKLFR